MFEVYLHSVDKILLIKILKSDCATTVCYKQLLYYMTVPVVLLLFLYNKCLYLVGGSFTVRQPTWMTKGGNIKRRTRYLVNRRRDNTEFQNTIPNTTMPISKSEFIQCLELNWRHKTAYSRNTVNYFNLFINSFDDLYRASLSKLLRGAPDLSTIKTNSFGVLIERVKKVSQVGGAAQEGDHSIPSGPPHKSRLCMIELWANGYDNNPLPAER